MSTLRLAFIAFFAWVGMALAQAPPPVPALPDTPRITSYSLSASNCACAVNFALYGDSTDYWDWVEVWINGVNAPYNGVNAWTVTSPTGPLATIPRPVTDAVLTFANPVTGTVQIVGARRPRRVSQFSESRGVAARDLNQALTDIIAQNRETWDRTNDITGRALLFPPGNVAGTIPPPPACANGFLGFDSTGLNPVCQTGTPSLPSVFLTSGAAIAPGSMTLAFGGSGYSVGQSVTLAPSFTSSWTTYPIVTINSVSSGVVTGFTLTNPGVAVSTTAASGTFTQSATSGVGTGLSVTGVLAPIASTLSFAGLSTGGTATNGNQFLGFSTPNSLYGGSESTFTGAYAGLSFVGSSFGDTAVGEDACGGDQGNFTNTGPGGNDCFGNDAGRNLSGTGGQNTFFGQDAGRGNDTAGNTGNQNAFFGNGSGRTITTGSTNVGVGVSTLNMITTGSNNYAGGAYSMSVLTTGSLNTGAGRFSLASMLTGSSNSAFGGNSQSNATGSGNTSVGAGSFTFVAGTNDVGIGLNAGSAITTGSNDVVIGPGVASTTLQTGNYEILLGGASNCDAASAGETNMFRLCEASGSGYAISANLTAGQVVVTVDGPVQLKAYTVAALPTCNAGAAGSIAYVTDANAPTYNANLTGSSTTKTLAMCNGSNWTAH